MQTLLAVDLGLKTGLAFYQQDGRLRWYRSHNFGSMTRLRRGVGSILRISPDLAWLILEGDNALGDIWEREAVRHQATVRRVSPELWRQRLLYPREQRSGAQAKQHADDLARQVIVWSGAARPTALRHDTAEAILIGLWGVLEVGWLAQLPPELRRS
jgi:hypothetical protein